MFFDFTFKDFHFIKLSSIWQLNQPFNDQCSHHIETSQLICSANQLTGLYMMGKLVVKGLNVHPAA